MKYLITNADDYGYRPDISRAIIDSHKNGYLTSTTVLINFVSNGDVQLALETPTLGFGLHLNLTSGEPVSDNWKNTYGSFSRPQRNEPKQFDREIWIPFFEKYKTKDVLIEYEAQIEKFKKLFNKLPTHIDSHHYSSCYESTFPAFIHIAQKYNLPTRLPKIWSLAKDQHEMGNITHVPELENKLRSTGIKTTTYFSINYYNRFENYLEEFDKELSAVKDTESIEISFHPGYEEDWRKKDLEILNDPKVKELFDANNFTLINFSSLKGAQ